MRQWLSSLPGARSGPGVARAFSAWLGGVFVLAFASAGVQVRTLIGEQGLMPVGPLLDSLSMLGFWDAPTLAWWLRSDTALVAGCWLGAACGVLAIVGVMPRVALALATLLYSSYVVAGRDFFAFQWDNLLLECGFLAALLPTTRRAPVVHLMFRVLLIKLYVESAIVKLASPPGDWLDGSAMAQYYETAPLPSPLAWYAHHLPAGWHTFESWATLAVELLLPFGTFAPRRARLVSVLGLTVFQLVNLATANYGFFVYLALGLHLFFLDDADVAKLTRRLPKLRLRWCFWRRRLSRRWLRWERGAALAIFCAYFVISLAQGLSRFHPAFRQSAWLADIGNTLGPWRLVNSYHLFGTITRQRLEAEFSTFDGSTWTAHDLRYKPGSVTRAPPIVAPHQPRLDFQLWFYGLRPAPRPPYVEMLLQRLCQDPNAVAGLFAEPLPEQPKAVRLVLHDTRFSSPEQRAATGAWWVRTGSLPVVTQECLR